MDKICRMDDNRLVDCSFFWNNKRGKQIFWRKTRQRMAGRYQRVSDVNRRTWKVLSTEQVTEFHGGKSSTTYSQHYTSNEPMGAVQGSIFRGLRLDRFKGPFLSSSVFLLSLPPSHSPSLPFSRMEPSRQNGLWCILSQKTFLVTAVILKFSAKQVAKL